MRVEQQNHRLIIHDGRSECWIDPWGKDSLRVRMSAEPGMDFCKRLAAAGCTAIIYTDIACDGAMRGTNLGLYRTLAKEVPGVAFTASGGISSEAELLELKKMGTAAAILGKSLYTGALDLARCVQLVQE